LEGDVIIDHANYTAPTDGSPTLPMSLHSSSNRFDTVYRHNHLTDHYINNASSSQRQRSSDEIFRSARMLGDHINDGDCSSQSFTFRGGSVSDRYDHRPRNHHNYHSSNNSTTITRMSLRRNLHRPAPQLCHAKYSFHSKRFSSFNNEDVEQMTSSASSS
jgi:hypothetical protein